MTQLVAYRGSTAYCALSTHAATGVQLTPHCNLVRGNAFWVYPKHHKLHSAQWDTHDAAGHCLHHTYVKLLPSGARQFACHCDRSVSRIDATRITRHYHVHSVTGVETCNQREFGSPWVGRLLIKRPGDAAPVAVKSAAIKDDVCYGGFEDPRYFDFRSQEYALGNGICATSGKRRMFLYCFGDGSMVALSVVGKTPNKSEKNWTPYVLGNELYFIYSFQPLCVLQMADLAEGSCSAVHGKLCDYDDAALLFGGTNLIAWKGKYVGFLHRRGPYKAVPVLYDPHKFTVACGQVFDIALPFYIAKGFHDHVVHAFPYDLRHNTDACTYELSACIADKADVRVTYECSVLDGLFDHMDQRQLHCDPRRNRAFWEYDRSVPLATKQWDTHDAASHCPHHRRVYERRPARGRREFMCVCHLFA